MSKMLSVLLHESSFVVLCEPIRSWNLRDNGETNDQELPPMFMKVCSYILVKLVFESLVRFSRCFLFSPTSPIQETVDEIHQEVEHCPAALCLMASSLNGTCPPYPLPFFNSVPSLLAHPTSLEPLSSISTMSADHSGVASKRVGSHPKPKVTNL